MTRYTHHQTRREYQYRSSDVDPLWRMVCTLQPLQVHKDDLIGKNKEFGSKSEMVWSVFYF